MFVTGSRHKKNVCKIEYKFLFFLVQNDKLLMIPYMMVMVYTCVRFGM